MPDEGRGGGVAQFTDGQDSKTSEFLPILPIPVHSFEEEVQAAQCEGVPSEASAKECSL